MSLLAVSRNDTMSEYDYAWEKLHTSVSILDGEGTRKELLEDAVVSSLCRISHEEQLPEELYDRYQYLMLQFEKIPTVGNVGECEKNIELMSDQEVRDSIDEIRSLYYAVCEYQDT